MIKKRPGILPNLAIHRPVTVLTSLLALLVVGYLILPIIQSVFLISFSDADTMRSYLITALTIKIISIIIFLKCWISLKNYL